MGSYRSLLVMVQPNVLRQRTGSLQGMDTGRLDPISMFLGKELREL